ncbi:MAG TPA: benzoate-CoA ligase family protein [Alphaproteobacteria bacterium]|nr:benzoate-CoA ligase family protein [Alphaproteobacteria bacterium]
MSISSAGPETPGFSQCDRTKSPPELRMPRLYNAAADFIDRNLVEGRGGRIAIQDDAGRYTYAELAERVNRAGNMMRDLGLGIEDRVLMLMLDSIAFPAVFFGAIKLGAVPIPINTLLTAADYDFMLRDSRAKLLIVSAALYNKVAPILAAQPFLRAVIVDGVEGYGRPRLDERLAAASATLEPAPTVADDICFWLYTSGSTGQPKAAVHLQSDMAYAAEYYGVAVLGIREDDVMFSAAKLFFAYGLGNAMYFAFRVGAAAVLMAGRPTPQAVITRLLHDRPTIFYGVPTLYAALLADPTLPKADALHLRRCVSAGEALPEQVARRWKAHTGVDILDGIGSTEMLHIFLSNRPDDLRYGTTGKAVPGYALRLAGEDGQPVTPGEVGDLYVSGPTSAPFYWNNRARSLESFHGRWTRTGDKYLVDDDGYYVYQGRSDDMLKVGGIYVSPFEVEAALVSHEAVLEAAVVGHADENGLIKPKAFVVLKDGATASQTLAQALKEHVKARLAPYKFPRWVEFVAELPKTATGKIQRFKLRQP